MIVIPLNEEARGTRRFPWVTLLLLAACSVAFFVNRTTDAEVDAKTEVQLETVWDFYAVRPWVKVDADLAYLLGAERVAATVQEFRARHAASSSPPIPDFVVHHDQVEFDAMVDELYDTMDAHSFFRLGFFPSTLEDPDATIVSYVLAHEGWLHLVANLVLVLLAGLFLEEVWGRAIYAVFVVSAAAAAAAGYALLDPEGGALGGASGIAAALAGAFLIRFAGTPIRFRYFYIPPFGGKFTAKGWVALPIYGATYLGVDYVLKHGAPGIEPPGAEFATWVHASGLVWGVGFAAILRATRIEERFIHPALEEKRTKQSNPVLDQALEAREKGCDEEAFELLAGEVASQPGNRDACLAFWDVASAVGRPEDAAGALLRVLRDEVGSGQKALAVTHWGEVTQRAPGARVDATLEVRIAGFLMETGEFDLAKFSIGRILDGHCGEPSAAVLHRTSRVAEDLDPSLALRAAEAALASPDLGPEERADLERLVAQHGAGGEAAPPPAAPSADDPNEQTGGQLFESSFDLQAHAGGDEDEHEDLLAEPAPAASAGEEDVPAPVVREDTAAGGDELNAAPFELDDMTVPGAEVPTESPAPEAVLSHGEVDLVPEETGDLPASVLDDAPASPGAEAPADESAALDVPEVDAAPAFVAADEDPSALDPTAIDLEAEPELPFEPQAAAPSAPEPMPEPEPSIPEPASLELPEPIVAEPAEPERPEPVAAPEPEPLVALTPEPLEEDAGAPSPPRRPLKRMDAMPVSLNAEALVVDVGERGKATLGLERIDAIAVAGVRGLKPKPVVLIDLLTNWLADDGQPLKIVRFRSDRFDPRKLVPDASGGSAALKEWLADLLAKSGALPMPDERSATGAPFRMYDSLEAYEAEVLRALQD